MSFLKNCSRSGRYMAPNTRKWLLSSLSATLTLGFVLVLEAV